MKLKIGVDQKRGYSDASITYIAEQVRGASTKRARALAALQRSDRRGPLYSALEQAEREQAINEEFKAVVAAKLELGFGESRDALLLIGRLEELQGDPLGRLDEAGLARATSLRPFVEEDVRKLPPAQLEAKIGALADGDDQAYRVVMHRALQARVAELDALVPANMTGADVPPAHREERARIAPLVEQLAAKLDDPELSGQIAEQNTRLDQARKLVAAVNAETRAIAVDEQEQRLVATRLYTPVG